MRIAVRACQTCHIPGMAKGQATRLNGDWSTVGEEIEPEDRRPVEDE